MRVIKFKIPSLQPERIVNKNLLPLNENYPVQSFIKTYQYKTAPIKSIPCLHFISIELLQYILRHLHNKLEELESRILFSQCLFKHTVYKLKSRHKPLKTSHYGVCSLGNQLKLSQSKLIASQSRFDIIEYKLESSHYPLNVQKSHFTYSYYKGNVKVMTSSSRKQTLFARISIYMPIWQ